jgi:mono/diheme cytochrome c family protein
MPRVPTTGVTALLAAALTTALAAQADRSRPAAANADPAVTAVAGPGWLAHLGVRFDDTSLGRGSSRYGAAPDEPATLRKPLALAVERHVSLTGADLYRLNCQACHRAEGTGAPPEVRSVLPAVQGSSLAMMRAQLQRDGRMAVGTPQSRSAEARAALYRRIRLGGEHMPPRAHLREPELDALYAYLSGLAHAPDAPAPRRVTVSWAHLGEQVIKGTCHICHDAAGPPPTSRALLEGAIPPLSALLTGTPVAEFVNKVRSGAPVYMGEPPRHYRGRMPVYDYLNDQEIAAGYAFLSAYPPRAQ